MQKLCVYSDLHRCHLVVLFDGIPYNRWEQLFGSKVQNYFLKCRITCVSERGCSGTSGKEYKCQLNSKGKDGYRAESEKESCVK